MHFSTPTLLAAAALIPSSMAHFCFNKLIVDGNYTGEYEYVRKNTNMNSPVTDVTSDDLRCNVGGLASGNVTSTYKVASGASVGFGLDTGIGHPGPVQVYLSKAPTGTEASAYDGSGDWFKVHEIGVKNITDQGLQWAADQLQNFTFTLPTEVPAGQYLMRVEAIALHGAETVGGAQFYISCAQLEVTSASSAVPDPTVKIPGVYTGTEPGIEINIYYPVPTNYTMPGPALWPADGSNSTSSATAASSASSVVSSVVASSAAASSSSSSSAAAVTSAAASTTSSVATQAAVVTASSSSASTEPIYPVSSNGTAPAFPTGSGAPAPSGFLTATRPFPMISASAAPSAGFGTAKKYAQCGGKGFSGASACESGSSCTVQNEWYSQCT